MAKKLKTRKQLKNPTEQAPEDLQYIQKNWTAIVRETSGLLKQMLKEATPKYNANSDEPILYIEFHNFQAEICTKNPDTIPLLKNYSRKNRKRSRNSVCDYGYGFKRSGRTYTDFGR